MIKTAAQCAVLLLLTSQNSWPKYGKLSNGFTCHGNLFRIGAKPAALVTTLRACRSVDSFPRARHSYADGPGLSHEAPPGPGHEAPAPNASEHVSTGHEAVSGGQARVGAHYQRPGAMDVMVLDENAILDVTVLDENAIMDVMVMDENAMMDVMVMDENAIMYVMVMDENATMDSRERHRAAGGRLGMWPILGGRFYWLSSALMEQLIVKRLHTVESLLTGNNAFRTTRACVVSKI